MSGVINQRATLGQGKGPDVELIVSGTALYATYHTLDGLPAVYDDDRELFCYARLVDGRFESTGVPVSAPPPPDVHASDQEADDVRAQRVTERESHLDQASRQPGNGEGEG
ncbi:MAG: hypothetical protein ACRD12_22400 [Acidimicrobiales bacterium]